MAIRRPKSNKNPPVFSHEFVIQNHADIVSCIAMVFVIGLMFQATNTISSLFVTMQHNITINESGTADQPPDIVYTYGMRDMFSAFFYFLICIVIHAVIQEYVLDKMNRKLHLSKVKHSKFNESGQLIVFYLVSIVWGGDIIYKGNYLLNINNLWEDYPHSHLSFMAKFYFLIQISYWLHNYPELYFQKVKKEEMASRIQYTTLYLAFITAGYLLNLTRISVCLIVLHYSVEVVFHLSRIIYFADKTEFSDTSFKCWNFLFVLVRLGSITLSVLTFWYGLEKSGVTEISTADGNFNTQLMRGLCLLAIGLLQAWMMWNFITFHLKRLREKKETAKSQGRLFTQTVKNRKKEEVIATENGSVKTKRSPKSKKNL